MSRIELIEFQTKAAERIVESTFSYFSRGPDKVSGRNIPYVGQLKAVTGAGKTPILATVTGRLSNAIILWTTVYGSVVDQTVKHLRVGGKYHHLFGTTDVEVYDLREPLTASKREELLQATQGVTILVSTVAAWNSATKDERLNVHRAGKDFGPNSFWDQLKDERQRPLWIVYDEAHNTTSGQIDQLDDLDPAGYFVASASPIKGKLATYLSMLTEADRKRRITPISTADVVDAQLLKSVISVVDYDSSFSEMIVDAARRRQSLEDDLSRLGAKFLPKAIYVVEKSNIQIADDKESRPVSIWKTLVNEAGVDPSAIAVYTSTKDLPGDAIRVNSIMDLSEQFTHIIFNKSLQEGWDDPSVYVCYFDGETQSATRIQQVMGRALRQPGGSHFKQEELNTAYFFVNCKNSTLEAIVDQLKVELRIYKGDDLDPDYEPIKVIIQRQALPKIPLKPQWADQLKVPMLTLVLPESTRLVDKIKSKVYSFGSDDRSSPGKALVNVVVVKTGEVKQSNRDLLEDMRMRCGTYLQTQIRLLSKSCANTINPSVFQIEHLNLTACYGSKAIMHYEALAKDIVDEYRNKVELQLVKFDPEREFYTVDAYQPSGEAEKVFQNAGHEHYDLKGFNPQELAFAKELDKFADFVWVRNKSVTGYGIELPLKSKSSSTFYPDFLWWVKDTVWAIDPTGEFILKEKLRTKLLVVPAPIKIALITPGKLDANYNFISTDGWTLSKARMGNPTPEFFDDLASLLRSLVDAS